MQRIPPSPPMSPESFYAKAREGNGYSSGPIQMPSVPATLSYGYNPPHAQAYDSEHFDYHQYARHSGPRGFQVPQHGSAPGHQHEQLSPGSSHHSILDEDESIESLEDQDDGIDESQLSPAERLSRKRRMKRFRLTHNQTRFMMNEFARQPHPDAAHRERLSQEIPGLSPRQVQVWFQNRRAKLKRLTVEDQERVMRSRELPAAVDPKTILDASAGGPSDTSGLANFYTTPNASGGGNSTNADFPRLGSYDQSYISNIPTNTTLGYQMRSTHGQPPRPSNINLLAIPAYGLSISRPQDSPMQSSFPTGSRGVAIDATTMHPSTSPVNIPQGNSALNQPMGPTGSAYWYSMAPQSQLNQDYSMQSPQALNMQYHGVEGAILPQSYSAQMPHQNFQHTGYQQPRRSSDCPGQVSSPFAPPPTTSPGSATTDFSLSSPTGVVWNNVYYPPEYN